MSIAIKKSNLILVFFLVSTSSCQFFRTLVGSGPERPTVNVTSVKVKRVGLGSIDLGLGLTIQNPNNFEIELKSLQYRIDADDKKLADGAYEDSIKIPKKANGNVELPLALATSHAIAVMKKIIFQGEDVMAFVDAKAVFVSPIGDINVDHQEKKSFLKLIKK